MHLKLPRTSLSPRPYAFLNTRPLLSSLQSSPRYFSTSSTLYHRRKPSDPDSTIPGTRIKIFREIPKLRQWRRQQLLDYRTVSLVPTMGALHAGHLSLIRLAASQTSSVVVSIYVNPTQFGLSEDLSSYPKTWESDIAQIAKLDRELADEGDYLGKIAAVFAPTTNDMYPSGPPDQAVDAKGSFVTITPVGALLEGKSRPTFFRGVATVCMKLFNIVQPEKVYFGQKDVQQTVVIKKMVKDFCLPIDVEIGPTSREADGLALSSRNVYLGARRRKVAGVLNMALRTAEKAWMQEGCRKREEVLGPAMELIRLLRDGQVALPASERAMFEVDYISLADPDTMEEVEVVDENKGAILSGAIRMLPVEEPQPGEDLGHMDGPLVRLIDNVILHPVKKES